MAEFTTQDGCTVTLTTTPEGDVLMHMRVEHGKKGLATATVANAPEGSKVIVGTHASLKLDASARARLRAALEETLPWPETEELTTPEGRLGILVRETFPWSIEASTLACQTIRGLLADLERAQAPSVALDGYEAVNAAEEERMAQELMEEHGYRPKEAALVPTSDVRQMLVEAHRKATDEYDRILTRQGDLLTATVKALRGDPPELVWWSHHDVAELATAAVEVAARWLMASQADPRLRMTKWEELTDAQKENFRSAVRAALAAEADSRKE